VSTATAERSSGPLRLIYGREVLVSPVPVGWTATVGKRARNLVKQAVGCRTGIVESVVVREQDQVLALGLGVCGLLLEKVILSVWLAFGLEHPVHV
jgi:hypothetical protein